MGCCSHIASALGLRPDTRSVEQLADKFIVACAPSHSSCVASRHATPGYLLERTPEAHDTRDKRGPPRQPWLCPCTIRTPSYNTARPSVKTASKRRATAATKACPGPIRVLPTHTPPLLNQTLASQPAGELLPHRDRPVDYPHPNLSHAHAHDRHEPRQERCYHVSPKSSAADIRAS